MIGSPTEDYSRFTGWYIEFEVGCSAWRGGLLSFFPAAAAHFLI